MAVGRFGEARLLYEERGAVESATLHLGADLFVNAGTPVRAPLAGVTERVGPRSIVLRHEDIDEGLIWVRLAGVAPAVGIGADLDAGEVVGAVAESTDRLPPHVHIQLAVDPVGEPPGLVLPSLGAAWRAIFDRALDESPPRPTRGDTT